MNRADYEALIEKATKAGACAPALEWLRSGERTLEELITQHADWAHWAIEAGVRLPPISSALQEKLSVDTNEGVRGCLARNQAVTPALQEKLSVDTNEGVRECLAGNQAVTPAAQEKLSVDTSRYVRECLAGNQSAHFGAERK